MFTCVKLKNFKSFNDITLDLTDKNNRPKSLVLIYGENGIGKSNFAISCKRFLTTNLKIFPIAN